MKTHRARASADTGVEPKDRPRRQLGLVPEFKRLLVLVRTALASGRRPWLAIVLGATTVAVWVLLRNRVVGPDLWHSGAVYASLPLTTELSRLPMSLFLPTPLLPVWGAAAQLVLVIGIAEVVIGRWLTVLVATVGHVVATLSARVVIDSVHGSLLGLTPALGHVLDTGPSAAATAVGAYLLLVLGMNRGAVLLCISLAIAAAVAPGIDGVEHMVALACGLLAGRCIPLRVSLRRAPDETRRLLSSRVHTRL
jgi:hypothetical protein